MLYVILHQNGSSLLRLNESEILKEQRDNCLNMRFTKGYQFAVLTDGREWRFFHPTAQGDYRERKVHEMDLTETDSEKSAERLNRYLNYKAICSGEAAKAIEEDYRNVSRQRQVATRLPEAWSKA